MGNFVLRPWMEMRCKCLFMNVMGGGGGGGVESWQFDGVTNADLKVCGEVDLLGWRFDGLCGHGPMLDLFVRCGKY